VPLKAPPHVHFALCEVKLWQRQLNQTGERTLDAKSNRDDPNKQGHYQI
jgi:hypothetical protein